MLLIGAGLLTRSLTRRARRCFSGLGVERACFREWDREDRAIPVNHVEAKQQRDLEPRLGHRDPLHRRRVLGAHDVEQPAELTRAHQLHLLGRGAPAGRQETQLAELFFEGHAGEQGVEVLGGSGCGDQRCQDQDMADARHRNALSGPRRCVKSYAQNGTSEALALFGTVGASFRHYSISREMDPCRVIVFCGSPASPCCPSLCRSPRKPPQAPFKATSRISKGRQLSTPR